MNPKKDLQPVSLSESLEPATSALESARIRPKVDVSKVYANLEPVAPGSTSLSNQPRRRFHFKKVRNIILVFLLIIVAVTFFTKDEYRHITVIEPVALKQPIQTPTTAKEFTYQHKDVEYSVTPLFEYELNGMVVSRLDYEKISFSGGEPRADNTLFPTDLCMLWGENLSSGVYQSSSTTFSQGGRWCHWRWGEGKEIINEAVANNHLMFTNSHTKAKLKNIQAGDQVKIIGKLVNVRTLTQGAPREKIVNRHSSTVRTDTGGTSCEDILVEDIIILRKNHHPSQDIFNGSLLALGLLIGTSLFVGLIRNYHKKK